MEKTCRICGRPKDLDEFGTSKKNKDGRDSRCRQCRRNAYVTNRDDCLQKVKNAYARNRAARLAQKSVRYKECRDDIISRRREAWKNNPQIKESRNKYHNTRRNLCYEKLGNKCRRCGNGDSKLLCIDHVNDDGQNERASGMSHVKLWNKIIKDDLDGRYQLLCFNCNLKKSIHKVFSPPLTGETKLCPTCLNMLDLAFFRKDGDQTCYECRVCSASRDRIIKQIAFAKLGGAKCVGCGTEDLDTLTLDHVNNDGGGRWRSAGGVALCRSVIYSTPTRTDLQVLCLNCNIKKHFGEDFTERRSPVEKPVSQNQSIDFEFSDVSIEKINDHRVVEFLEQHHYIGYGRRATVSYVVLLFDNVIAVAKFTYPIRMEVTSSMKVEHGKCLELDRLCVHPSYHKKNFVSWILARVVKIMRLDFPEITTLVSFADPEAGHDGTVYKAANWTELGKTSRSFVYVDINGNKLHKKTVYNAAKSRKLKETGYAELMGLRRSYTVPKIKFVYDLR